MRLPMAGSGSESGTSSVASSAWAALAWRLLAVLLPVVLLLTNVGIAGVNPLLIAEYRRPGFPPDGYGLTTEERIRWAKIARDFLINDAGTEFLADLRFEDGSPVYNERELRHMDDVKRLVQAALWAWAGSLLIAGLAAIGLLVARRTAEMRRGLRAGARLTLGLMIVLVVGLVVGFSVVFVGFHRIFFEGDTWLFLYSDTLIRLFPEQFWRDAFLFVAVTTLAEAGILGWVARRR
jgi:integral membrane protein (TIGR01906 family)